MAIEIVRNGRVLVITNSDPATRNAISSAEYDALAGAFRDASSDRSIGSVVVTGAGGFFCSGGNVNVLRERLDMDEAGRRAGVDRLNAMALALRDCSKPVIAAVEGGAAGAGLALALACDLIVSASDAYFVASYVRIGLTPDGGTTAYLAKALPRQLCNEMLMTGNRLGAERLHAAGVVNTVTEPGAALDAALRVAHDLANGANEAISAIKSLALSGEAADLADQLEFEAQSMARAFARPEGREGVTAFLEKRKADYCKLR